MALTVDSTRNPIKVTGTTTVSTLIYANPIFVKFIYWYIPTTIGHLVALKDGDGNDIMPLQCEVANESQVMPAYARFDSIYCDDMDSGTLYIFIA